MEPRTKKQKNELYNELTSGDEQLNHMYENVFNYLSINICYLNYNEKKFIVEIQKNNTSYVKNNYHEIIEPKNMIICFALSTIFSTSCEIVDFLIECFKINVNGIINSYDGYFSFMCRFSSNVHMIKYLINKYNIENENLLEYCLYQACNYYKYGWNNESNLDVIRFLVEEKNTNINVKKSPDNKNYFLKYSNPHNKDAIIYLLQNIKDVSDSELIDIIICYDIYCLKEIICELNNYVRVNRFLWRCYEIHNVVENEFIIEELNQLIFDSSNRKRYKIDDPFLKSWEEYVKMVDELKIIVPIPIIEVNLPEIKSQCPDFSNYSKSDILFKNNEIIYYGDRIIFYNSLLFLRDVCKNCNFDEPIILTGSLPKYLMNHYINASYTGEFFLADVKPPDLKVFINFIDQYPTTTISINNLEQQIIQFFDHNKLDYTNFDDLKDIFIKYRLKYLYLHMHNRLYTK